MPRFFLHMYNATGRIEDEEGQEHPNLAAARESAILSLRSVACEEVKEGTLDLRGRIEIADETGAVLMTVMFPEAVGVLEAEEGL